MFSEGCLIIRGKYHASSSPRKAPNNRKGHITAFLHAAAADEAAAILYRRTQVLQESRGCQNRSRLGQPPEGRMGARRSSHQRR